MEKKFACLTGLLILVGLGLVSCGTSSSSNTVTGTGLLYVTTQGNQSISAWGINLTTGVISTNGNAAKTGNMPAAVVTVGSAAFVANKQDNTISSFTLNADGTLTATGSATTLKSPALTPMAMTVDPTGKFLFVANQGTFDNSQPGSISVLSISGTTLTEITGSPFSTEPPNSPGGTGPVSLTLTPDGKYLYVANQFTNSVGVFTVDTSSGALTQLLGQNSSPPPPYPVGTTPSAITLTPDGNVLYVANEGSNNVSAFTACTSVTLTCVTPDGLLKPVAGSPFSVGLGPVALAGSVDSQGEYLYVANYNSSQVSQFKVAIQTGVLTALSPPTVSTGANPAAIVVRAGSGTVLSTGGKAYFVFTSNATAGTISSYSFDSTTGLLTLIGAGTPTTTAGQPSAMAVR